MGRDPNVLTDFTETAAACSDNPLNANGATVECDSTVNGAAVDWE